MVARLRAARQSQLAPGDYTGGMSTRGQWLWTLAGAAAGAALFAAIFLPWLIEVPGAWATVWGETAGHSVSMTDDEPSALYYISRLPVLLGPWAVFVAYGLVLAILGAWRGRAQQAWLVYVLAWLGGTLVGFSVAAAKHDHYILPMFPAAAALAALAIRHFLATGGGGVQAARPRAAVYPRRRRRPGWGLGAADRLCGVPCQAGVLRKTWLARGGPDGVALRGRGDPGGGGPGGRGCGGRAGGPPEAGRLGRGPGGPHGHRVGGRLGHGLERTERAVPMKTFSEYIRANVPDDVPIYYLGSGNRTVIYYVGRTLPTLDADKDLPRTMAEGRPFYLILNSKEFGTLAGVEGLARVHETPNPFRPREGFLLLRFAGPKSGPAARASRRPPEAW